MPNPEEHRPWGILDQVAQQRRAEAQERESQERAREHVPKLRIKIADFITTHVPHPSHTITQPLSFSVYSIMSRPKQAPYDLLREKWPTMFERRLSAPKLFCRVPHKTGGVIEVTLQSSAYPETVEGDEAHGQKMPELIEYIVHVEDHGSYLIIHPGNLQPQDKDLPFQLVNTKNAEIVSIETQKNALLGKKTGVKNIIAGPHRRPVNMTDVEQYKDVLEALNSPEVQFTAVPQRIVTDG